MHLLTSGGDDRNRIFSLKVKFLPCATSFWSPPHLLKAFLDSSRVLVFVPFYLTASVDTCAFTALLFRNCFACSCSICPLTGLDFWLLSNVYHCTCTDCVYVKHTYIYSTSIIQQRDKYMKLTLNNNSSEVDRGQIQLCNTKHVTQHLFFLH